jgi:predicted secreted Zn-dependent protease
MRPYGSALLAACLWAAAPATAADWTAVEKVGTYAIEGKTGAALYESIGKRGPRIGVARAIAHTTFTLTWSRKYEPRGDGCVLASARPNLTITYLLPKPSAKLPDAVRKSWDAFASGLAAHEKVHGDHIKEMVREIEAYSVGLTEPDDPACKAIRTTLTKRLSELSLAQRARSRDFDRVEMGQGGNIHQLILALVNGP